jgi:hypothetical protein
MVSWTHLKFNFFKELKKEKEEKKKRGRRRNVLS